MDVLHAQALLAGLQVNLRELFLQFTPNHVADDFIQVGVRHVQLRHVRAVAHDGRAVADLHDLLEAVGNIDDGHAAPLQHADRVKQNFNFTVGQRRGGLIHDEHPGIDGEGFGHLHHLLLRHAQIADQRVRVDVHAELVQQPLGLFIHPAPVHLEAVLHQLSAHEDVLRHRELLREVQLLVDGADVQMLCILGRVDLHFLSFKQDLALIFGIRAGENLHQRGLSRAVLPQQRVHLALAHGEVDVVQRQHAGEALHDAAHLKEFRHGMFTPTFVDVRDGNAAACSRRRIPGRDSGIT